MVEDGNYFTPKFLRRIRVVDIDSSSKASQARNITGKNISKFYQYLYAKMCGGKVSCPKRWELELLENGDSEKLFFPDIVQRDSVLGEGRVEVKCTSKRNLSFFLPSNQVSDYLYYSLRGVEKNKAPFVNYAFFRYGSHETLNLHRQTIPSLVEKLSQGFCELVVVPLNAFLFMYALAPEKTNHRSKILEHCPPEVRQRIIRADMFNCLHDGLDDFSTLKRKVINYGESPFGGLDEADFFLGNLSFKKRECPSNVSCSYRGKNYPIKPFQITEYSFENAWWENPLFLIHLSENYPRFHNALGLKNKYGEMKEVPF